MKAILIQSIPFCPWATRANPTVAPTMLWVVDTGSFKIVATNNHTHEPANQFHNLNFQLFYSKTSLQQTLITNPCLL